MGVSIPPWEALAEGLWPPTGDAEREPCQVSHGSQPRRSTFTTETVWCGHGCHQTSVLWCDRRVAHLRPCHSRHCQCIECQRWILSRVVSFCFAAFCLCPSPFASALHCLHLPVWPSTRRFLATTAQRAAQLGCLAEEDLQRKMPSRRFAEMEGLGFPRT